MDGNTLHLDWYVGTRSQDPHRPYGDGLTVSKLTDPADEDEDEDATGDGHSNDRFTRQRARQDAVRLFNLAFPRHFPRLIIVQDISVELVTGKPCRILAMVLVSEIYSACEAVDGGGSEEERLQCRAVNARCAHVIKSCTCTCTCACTPAATVALG